MLYNASVIQCGLVWRWRGGDYVIISGTRTVGADGGRAGSVTVEETIPAGQLELQVVLGLFSVHGWDEK